MPDLINGIFGVLGGLFIALSIAKLHQEKTVRGVSIVHVAFFTSWSWYHVYFFTTVNLWWSWAGAVGMMTANTIWLCQMVYYSRTRRPFPELAQVIELTPSMERERDQMVKDLLIRYQVERARQRRT